MTTLMKPMKAAEADLATLKYPLIASPKLDGLRAVVVDGQLRTNSLKPFPNKYVQGELSKPEYEGFDGELIVGPPNAKDVYRASNSGLMAILGEPTFTYYVFDLWNEPWISYSARQSQLEDRAVFASNLEICCLGYQLVDNETQLLQYEETVLAEGYEGLMLRDPDSLYKFGRSSTKQGIILKLKRFVDSEAEVIGFEEQMHNTNEAVKNELGRTKRSTCAEGLVPKGTLGALIVRDVKTGVEFKIGTGLNDFDRQEIWDNRERFLGTFRKYKSFPIGVKDAPRHPVDLGARDVLDMAA